MVTPFYLHRKPMVETTKLDTAITKGTFTFKGVQDTVVNRYVTTDRQKRRYPDGLSSLENEISRSI